MPKIVVDIKDLVLYNRIREKMKNKYGYQRGAIKNAMMILLNKWVDEDE